MSGSLGILVTSDKHLDKVIELSKAAKMKEVEVFIFFTHLGTLLTQDPRFAELQDLGRLAVCNVGFESNGLEKPVIGVDEKDFATQALHAELIDDCDRYVVF